MNTPSYSFEFNEILGEPSIVRCADHIRTRSYISRLGIDDLQLIRKEYPTFPSVISDVIDIAAAVHFADRLADKSTDQICDISLNLPLREPWRFNAPSALKKLEEILYWYTGNHWNFLFPQRTGEERAAEAQAHLPFDPIDQGPSEIALWSGGLDSMAGLYNRIMAQPDTYFTLVGTGSNIHTHAIQRYAAKKLREVFKNRVSLVQIPLTFEQTAHQIKNRYPRARGFAFLLIGGACAYLEGKHTLNVYENGIGAINLPFRASEIGLDHSRSVHPTSLYKVGLWFSNILGEEFTIRNPFVFWTKAQMCEPFSLDMHAQLIAETYSCDRLRHESPRQCGNCSSCLLRKYALAVNELLDPTLYVQEGFQQEGDGSTNHLPAMLAQVKTLRTALNNPSTWELLSKAYEELQETAQALAITENMKVNEVSSKLTDLFRTYVCEWENLILKREQNLVARRTTHSAKPLTEERMLQLWN